MRKILALVSLFVAASCTYAPAAYAWGAREQGALTGIAGLWVYQQLSKPPVAVYQQPAPVYIQQPQPVYVNPPVVVQPQANVYQPQQYCESPAVVDQFGNHRQITYCYYK